jgi:hypothetical protein
MVKHTYISLLPWCSTLWTYGKRNLSPPPLVCQLLTWVSTSHSPLKFALAGCCVASCCAASTSPYGLYDTPPPSLVLMPRNLHLSSSQGAAGFQGAAASCLLVPPAGCHNASCRAAVALCPLDNPPCFVCERLPSYRPLVHQLVVASPLLSRRCCLSSS